MKSIFLFLLLSIGTLRGFSQKIRFTDAGNKWYYTKIAVTYAPYLRTDTGTLHYYYKGLKTVAGVEYHEMVQHFSSKFDNANDSSIIYVREDTANGIVYGRQPQATAEHVWYDYNYSVGDSAAYMYDPTTISHVVDTVDSVIINGVTHKSIHFKSIAHQYRNYWVIEGIGNTILNISHDQYNIASPLICFNNNGVVPMLPYPIQQKCEDSVLNIETTMTDTKSLVVYPQPANEYVTLQLPAIAKNYHIFIYNNIGSTVYEQKAEDNHVIKINSPGMGMYYYKLYTDNNSHIHTGKLMFN